MKQEEVVQNLKKNLNTAIILLKEPMKKHTSFKVGGVADIYIKASQIEDIQSVVKVATQNNLPLNIIGNGSNILVQDNGIRGIVLEVGVNKQNFQQQEEEMIVTVRSRC